MIALESLDEKMRSFVQVYTSNNVSPAEAAKLAGYEGPRSASLKLLEHPGVLQAINLANAKKEVPGTSREDVLLGLLEAADLARVLSEPKDMVAAYREIGRIQGHYAPEKKELEVNVTGVVLKQKLARMTDDELLRLAAESNAIEAEFEEMDEDDE
jgi:phage terminase small subunit